VRLSKPGVLLGLEWWFFSLFCLLGIHWRVSDRSEKEAPQCEDCGKLFPGAKP
jgi:hypothetical protein